jgi:choline dehydrogenase-like flavoprotein
MGAAGRQPPKQAHQLLVAFIFGARKALLLEERRDRRLRHVTPHVTHQAERRPAIAPLLEEESFPGAKYESDEELMSLFRRLSTCGTHAVATCRMGSDNQAVVDPDLRVHGVTGLRVVDCSVMPSLVSGNTNAPAMALAWAAAERIQASRRA